MREESGESRTKTSSDGRLRYSAAAAVLFAWSGHTRFLRSYLVMGVYSAQQLSASVLREVRHEHPRPHRGWRWYPQMLVFNADGFAAWSGIDVHDGAVYLRRV